MQAAHRLACGWFDEETQGVEHQRVSKERTEDLSQGGMDRLLFPSLRYSRRQGEVKTELPKNIRVPPKRQINFFLTTQHGGPAPG